MKPTTERRRRRMTAFLGRCPPKNLYRRRATTCQRSSSHHLILFLVAILVVFPSTLALAKSSSSPFVVTSGGLRNLGNTCYMNAQLQCAFHIPLVRQVVMLGYSSGATKDEDDNTVSTTTESDSDDSTTAATATDDSTLESSTEEKEDEDDDATEPPQPRLSEALLATRELFQGMLKSSSMPYTPRAFCARLGIPPLVQQDSQEFWKLLLNAMKVDALTELYRGQYTDYIKALDGSGRTKQTPAKFLDLSLDVVMTGEKKQNSDANLITSLQQQFGTPELLSVEEGNGWRPAKGEEKVDAHKGSSLQADTLPPILQFHLKRFHYDWQTDTTTKLNDRFTFPQHLDLAEICSVGDSSSNTQYELQAVVVHVGEYGAGHYYAYVRPNLTTDNNQEQQQWFRFNDDVVEAVTLEEVEADVFGGRCVNRRKRSSEKVKENGKHGNVLQRVGRMLRGNRQKTGGPFGWGGPTSNAYVVQYIQKAQISRLYNVDFTKG